MLYTDATYLIWKGKKYYQSKIIDGYNKEIVDVKWYKYNKNKLVMDNLNDEINKIKLIKKGSEWNNNSLRPRISNTHPLFISINVYLTVL